MISADTSSRSRIFALLIAAAVGMAVAHVLAATLVYEPALHADEKARNRRVWPRKTPKAMPTFSSNDRSRWATVRALVDDGTYVVGRRDKRLVLISAATPLAADNVLTAAALAQAGYQARIKDMDTGIIFEDGWQTVDRVLHPQTLEFYSSKPPFLATLMAGLYWLLQAITGWTLVREPAEVVRTLLLLVNVVPFGLYLYVLGRLVNRLGTTDWGRLYVMTAGCFATLVTPFLFTFNNHTLGTFSVLFALALTLTIWERKQVGGAAWNLGRVWHHYVLAGLLAGFAVTNELPALSFAAAIFVLLLWWSPGRTLLLFVPAAAAVAGGYFWTNYAAVGQLRPAYFEFYGPWYQYEGSHFRQPVEGQVRYGIDFARFHESWPAFATNLLVGHHGWLSLSPIWVLAVIGMMTAGLSKLRTRLPWFVPGLTLAVSVAVIGFYLSMPEGRNYGGWSVGPRWLIWLTPLLLLTMLPVADWLGARAWGRRLALVFLGISALSAHYPGWNPWRMPWIYDLFEWQGWIPF